MLGDREKVACLREQDFWEKGDVPPAVHAAKHSLPVASLRRLEPVCLASLKVACLHGKQVLQFVKRQPGRQAGMKKRCLFQGLR